MLLNKKLGWLDGGKTNVGEETNDQARDELHAIIQKALFWLVPTGLVAVGILIWGTYNTVVIHDGKFGALWTNEFYEELQSDLEYPLVHETFRKLYLEEELRFKEQVRQFMAAGGRFSSGDASKMEERLHQQIQAQWARIDAQGKHISDQARYIREQEKRINQTERELSILRSLLQYQGVDQ